MAYAMMYPKGNQGKRTDINFSQNSEKLTASEANNISRARFILKHDSESAKLVRDGHPDASYSEWCEQSGEHPEPQRRWGMRLGERGGFTRQRRMVGFFWLGIGLKSPHEPNEPNEPEKTDSPRENNRAQKYAESGSFGSYHSCPPDDGLAPPQPVDTTPSRNAPLPPTASSDAGELWAILKQGPAGDGRGAGVSRA